MKIKINRNEDTRVYEWWQVSLAMWLMWFFGMLAGVAVALLILPKN